MAVAVTEELLFFCNSDVKFKTGPGRLMTSYPDGTKKKEIWGKASARMWKMGMWNLHIVLGVVILFGILSRILGHYLQKMVSFRLCGAAIWRWMRPSGACIGLT